MSGSPPHDRFHELDGLRALAITLVVLHHGVSSPIVAMLRASGQPLLAELIYETGASGVELFFVLSGIVLLRPYLRRERSFKPAIYAGRCIVDGRQGRRVWGSEGRHPALHHGSLTYFFLRNRRPVAPVRRSRRGTAAGRRGRCD